MASGDGWLVRLRTAARALTSAELRALAELARTYGNGIIELTRRGNLQLRGLRMGNVAALREQLVALGLVDASALREGRPALLVDPVAAVSSNDLVSLSQTLDEALAESTTRGSLSPKLGVVLDAGSGSVSNVDADIRLVVKAAGHAQFFVGTRAGAELLGECTSAQAPDVVRALLAALADYAADSGNTPTAAGGATDRPRRAASGTHSTARARTEAGARRAASAASLCDAAGGADPSGRVVAPRIRDFVAARGVAALRASCAALLSHCTPTKGSSVQPLAALGFCEAGERSWFGVAVPFGSASHVEWAALAELADQFGAPEVRLTPGREVLFVGVRREVADELELAAGALGFITQPSDARRRVAACSGAPACSSAYGETRAFASALGARLAEGATLHVSGCEKGCASPGVADVTVVLAPGGARVAKRADVAAASCARVVRLEVVATKVGPSPATVSERVVR